MSSIATGVNHYTLVLANKSIKSIFPGITKCFDAIYLSQQPLLQFALRILPLICITSILENLSSIVAADREKCLVICTTQR